MARHLVFKRGPIPISLRSSTFSPLSRPTLRCFSSVLIDPSVGLTDDQKELQQRARTFADNEFAPNMQEWDRTHFFPLDTFRKGASTLGFGGLYTRPDYGGSGLSRHDSTLIFESLATGCVSTTAYITLHNTVTWVIDTYGTESQQLKYLPDLISMKKLACICLTEPGAGSDAVGLTTKAIKKGSSHYILNGSKAFISGAGDSDLYLVMARTGGCGPKGISCFLIEKGMKGLSFGKKENKLGWNSQPTRSVIMEDCEVPVENLIGQEGQGFMMAMKGLNGGRVNISACSLGGAQSALEQTMEMMMEKTQKGLMIQDGFQPKIGTRFKKLTDMTSRLLASRLMVRKAAKMLDDRHPDALVICAMAKTISTEKCFWITDQCLQFLNDGYPDDSGSSKEFKVQNYWRDLRVHRILGGENSVMRMVASRVLLQ